MLAPHPTQPGWQLAGAVIEAGQQVMLQDGRTGDAWWEASDDSEHVRVRLADGSSVQVSMHEVYVREAQG